MSEKRLVVVDREKDWQIVLRDPVGQHVVVYSRGERRCAVVKATPVAATTRHVPSGEGPGVCPMCGQRGGFFTGNTASGTPSDFKGPSPRQSSPGTSPVSPGVPTVPRLLEPSTTSDYFLLIDALPRAYGGSRDGGSTSEIKRSGGGERVDSGDGGDGNDSNAPGTARSSTQPYGRSLSPDAFNEGYYSRFFVERKMIGCGSFGSVFLCDHTLQGVTLGEFAVKKVPVGDSVDWCLKVLQEVTILQTLHHPNIVDYKHSWLEHDSASAFAPRVPCLFVLMEYADGGNLAQHIWPHGYAGTPRDIPDATLLCFFVDICKGLRHLHAAGLVHRDLKPENILLRTLPESVQKVTKCRWRLMISDFGQTYFKGSKLAGASGVCPTSPKGLRHYGTVVYQAPESLGDSGVFTEASDMWGLGAILYAMAYTRLAFDPDEETEQNRDMKRDGEGSVAVEEAVRQRRFIMSRGLQLPAVPVRSMPIRSLIRRLLSIDPVKRPTASQVIKALVEISPSANTGSAIPVEPTEFARSESIEDLGGVAAAPAPSSSASKALTPVLAGLRSGPSPPSSFLGSLNDGSLSLSSPLRVEGPPGNLPGNPTPAPSAVDPPATVSRVAAANRRLQKSLAEGAGSCSSGDENKTSVGCEGRAANLLSAAAFLTHSLAVLLYAGAVRIPGLTPPGSPLGSAWWVGALASLALLWVDRKPAEGMWSAVLLAGPWVGPAAVALFHDGRGLGPTMAILLVVATAQCAVVSIGLRAEGSRAAVNEATFQPRATLALVQRQPSASGWASTTGALRRRKRAEEPARRG